MKRERTILCAAVVLSVAIGAPSVSRAQGDYVPGKSQVHSYPKSAPNKPVVKVEAAKGEITLDQLWKFDGTCRWYNQDVLIDFMDPDYPNCKLTSAALAINYGDADFHSADPMTPPELDVVGLGNNGNYPIRRSIDIIRDWNGRNGAKKWDVYNEVDANTSTSIPFKLNIDAASTTYRWCLRLYQVRLVTTYKCDWINPKQDYSAITKGAVR